MLYFPFWQWLGEVNLKKSIKILDLGLHEFPHRSPKVTIAAYTINSTEGHLPESKILMP